MSELPNANINININIFPTPTTPTQSDHMPAPNTTQPTQPCQCEQELKSLFNLSFRKSRDFPGIVGITYAVRGEGAGEGYRCGGVG